MKTGKGLQERSHQQSVIALFILFELHQAFMVR